MRERIGRPICRRLLHTEAWPNCCGTNAYLMDVEGEFETKAPSEYDDHWLIDFEDLSEVATAIKPDDGTEARV